MIMRVLVPVLLLATLCAAPPAAIAQATMPVNIGINVGGVSDFATESFFVDAMKHSRHWGSVATPWDQAAAVDTLGWPTQDAGVVVLCCVADTAGHSLLAGTYALSFSGQGQVALDIYAGGVSDLRYDAATNTSTATVTLADSGAGTSLFLSFTNTQRTPTSPVGSGVTNVTLIRPQVAPNGQSWWTSPGQLFTTPYLALVSRYSTLRFMDFMATNNNTTAVWGQRTTPAQATQQSPAGASWEYVAALANATNRDIWINIPDEADDAYVRALATLLHTTLNPSIHVWMEYSNEVWNFIFQQAGRNQAAAEAEVAANPQSPLALGCSDYDNCRYLWGERRIGRRDVQIGRIFASVWGSDAARLRPVFATQLGQTSFVDAVMTMIAATEGAPSRHLYAIAEAPYFTGDNSLDNQSEAQLLADAATNLTQVASAQAAFTTDAIYWGLHSVTYEGGPGMFGTASLDNKIAANRDPQMGALVSQALRGAFAGGVSLYNYYTGVGQYGQYGMWGTTEDVFDASTAKIAAIAGVLADGTEPLTAGHALPATIDATHPDLNSGGYIIAGSYAYVGDGSFYGYLIDVPAAGMYAVSLSAGNYYAATQATLQIDRKTIGRTTVADTGGPGPWVNTKPVKVALTAGLHVLSFVANTGAYAVQSLSVTPP